MDTTEFDSGNLSPENCCSFPSSPFSTPSRRRMDPQYRERLQLTKNSPVVRLFDEPAISPNTPIRYNQRNDNIYSDRFIPSRLGSNLESGLLETSFSQASRKKSPQNANTDGQREAQQMHNLLLKSELLGFDSNPPRIDQAEERTSSASKNMFKFKVSRGESASDVKSKLHMGSPLSSGNTLALHSPLANAVASQRKPKRKISKVPFKVLDAPALADDFYLNLVDWGSTNILAVGLGNSVYLWSAASAKVTKLCELTTNEDCVTSVAWTRRGTHLAVGTNLGDVQIWDVTALRKVRTLSGHKARVGALAWGGPMGGPSAHGLASGSRDRTVLLRDARQPRPDAEVLRLEGHRQEVCGLRWSFDDTQLASGGNDNKLFVWSAASHQTPLALFGAHCAAVKALAWSPHQHGLLASGGGTADRCIRFWNTLTETPISCVDTGSQVCNLMWSKTVNEIVSTHGYSLNQIILWRYPVMTKVATLTGHTYRVLYLAMSPDGQTIVTGAGDETLRFWNTFPGSKNSEESGMGTSLLFPAGAEIR